MSGPRKKKWVLSKEALELLLSKLDPDRDRAGEKYEIIRRKLVRCFEWRNCPYPEDHADETLNRVAKKLQEGEIVQNVLNYSYGVASNLFHEILKELERQREALNHLPPLEYEPDPQPESEQRVKCFEDCMKKLTNEKRELIVKYYHGEGAAKIKNRKQLAKQLGIPPNALRIQTHRIREKLELCVRECLDQYQT